MPCITFKNGLRLNLKEGSLNDEKFRDFLKKLELADRTRFAYFIEPQKDQKS